MYLLDTNVVSEFSKTNQQAAVIEWFRSIPSRSLHLSVLSMGELRLGVERLSAGRKREGLEGWLSESLPRFFFNRILPIDQPVSDRWGRLLAESRRTLPLVDSLIAATAIHHGLTLVTRNTKDFSFPQLDVFNPWH